MSTLVSISAPQDHLGIDDLIVDAEAL